jgi:hypothetical protein
MARAEATATAAQTGRGGVVDSEGLYISEAVKLCFACTLGYSDELQKLTVYLR